MNEAAEVVVDGIAEKKVLLAVDVGLKTGWALVDEDGRLLRVAGRSFRQRERYKRWARGVVHDIEHHLVGVVAEGDRQLAQPFRRAAEARGARFWLIGAGRWRDEVFAPHEVRTTALAKRAAVVRGRALMQASALPPPKKLRHDVAEAICIAQWAAGWRFGHAEGPPAEEVEAWSPIPRL